MLVALGLSLVFAMSVAVENSRDCNAALGKLRDRLENRVFQTTLKCGCDGRLDLSTGCYIPGIF
jgi:hypothetical protein